MTSPKKSVLVGPRLKWILYSLLGVLWATGAFWLVENYLAKPSDAGLSAQALCLRVHGAAAMGFLMIFGAFLLEHVPAGWTLNTRRPSGSSLIGFLSISVLTGWGLYYIANEGLRYWIGLIHWGIGLAIPLIIFIHVRARRAETYSARHSAGKAGSKSAERFIHGKALGGGSVPGPIP